MPGVLEVELRTYLERKADLLRKGAGKVVLIHGTTVHGLFESEEEALAAGYDLLGLDEAFFIRRVEEREPVAFFGGYPVFG